MATKRFSEAIPNKVKEFYPDLPQIPFDQLKESDFTYHDATILKDFRTEYGVRDAALIMVEDMAGEKFTTMSSNMAIVNQIKTAIEEKYFPLIGKVNQPEGKTYFIIE